MSVCDLDADKVEMLLAKHLKPVNRKLDRCYKGIGKLYQVTTGELGQKYLDIVRHAHTPARRKQVDYVLQRVIGKYRDNDERRRIVRAMSKEAKEAIPLGYVKWQHLRDHITRKLKEIEKMKGGPV